MPTATAIAKHLQQLEKAPFWQEDRLDKVLKRVAHSQRLIQRVIAQARRIELGRDDAQLLFDQFNQHRQRMSLAAIQLKARYSGHPQLSLVIKALEKTAKQIDDALVGLQVLLDAYAGYAAPEKLPKTLGPAWEKVLDHVLLYHELQKRTKESQKKISLDELRAQYGL
ncbi:MAG: hypothetical protein K6T71_05825 [Candidatus Bipolaricaulota bacterium]|nr:hypothetical protein [Candidatus Bipolaricaulota bacterium]